MWVQFTGAGQVNEGDGITRDGNTLSVKLPTDSGLTVSSSGLALGTPSNITVSSGNTVTTSTHAHAITSSASPLSTSSILKSEADGGLQLIRFGLGVDPDTDNRLTMIDGGQIGQANGPLVAFDDTNNYLEITGANVGIGTTSPSEKLTVTAGSVHIDTVGYSLALKTADGNSVEMPYVAGQNAYFGRRHDGTGAGLSNIYFRTGTDATIMTIAGSSVGIGTTAPGAKLDVVDATPVLRVLATGASQPAQLTLTGSNANSSPSSISTIRSIQDGGDTDSKLIFQTRLSGTLNDRVLIDKNGNVGIGTTSPDEILQVGSKTYSSLTNNTIQVIGYAANGDGDVPFGNVWMSNYAVGGGGVKV
jgi:hypothetical protein